MATPVTTFTERGVMPLRETATTIPTKKPGYACAIDTLKSTLDTDDLAWLQEHLENPAVKHQYIADVLSAEGHKISQGVVGRHRTRRCSCGTV